MIILSIETSCDETAAAVAEFNDHGKVKVLANIISSQIKIHKKYGGVVPSLASRAHLKNIIPILFLALKKSELKIQNIDYIAVTNGPGLIPSLNIGVSVAKALSYSTGKPLIGINHIEGHIYANWLKVIDDNSSKKEKAVNYKLWNAEFPILCLIVSGGHTQILLMKKDIDYILIGETVDDSAGEAFDKVAKLLNIGYPGGPCIENIARKGNKEKFNFTRPVIYSNDFNFSFSGLKTSVLYTIMSAKNKTRKNFSNNFKSNIAASFQQAVIDVLAYKMIKAAKKYNPKSIVLGGGVSSNKELQKQMKDGINKNINPVPEFSFPLPSLTTDNGLMIAIAAYYHIKYGKFQISKENWKKVKANASLKIC